MEVKLFRHLHVSNIMEFSKIFTTALYQLNNATDRIIDKCAHHCVLCMAKSVTETETEIERRRAVFIYKYILTNCATTWHRHKTMSELLKNSIRFIDIKS